MSIAARLDDHGRPAWIALLVVTFIIFWPAGLALLAYMIWSGRMSCHTFGDGYGHGRRGRWYYDEGRGEGCGEGRDPTERRALDEARHNLHEAKRNLHQAAQNWRSVTHEWRRHRRHGPSQGSASSGNRAFDEYRADTLRRLEEEQRDFHDFLDRLRFAKDKAEFDEFLAERRHQGEQAPPPADRPEDGAAYPPHD